VERDAKIEYSRRYCRDLVAEVEWMFASGHETDAFHALWFALGLRARDAKARPDAAREERLRQACPEWLAIIAWDWPAARRKHAGLQRLIGAFCPPEP
jgi:hypothetical protein